MKKILIFLFSSLVITSLVMAKPPEAPNPVVEGKISEWIAQLHEKDDAKRNAAVAALMGNADNAFPMLQRELKASTDSSYVWWLKVALQACEEKRTRPGEISITPADSKGLQMCEECKTGDGIYIPFEREGTRGWEVPKKGHYLYFIASDDFRQKAFTRLELEVEYLDAGTGSISLDYDSANIKAALNGAYENHPKQIIYSGGGKWRTARFHLPNARFRGSENCHTDFRFYNGSESMVIRHVRVWPSSGID